MHRYNRLKKPEWTPPKWVFGPTWAVMYTAQGYAGWRVLHQVPAVERCAIAVRDLQCCEGRLLSRAAAAMTFSVGPCQLACTPFEHCQVQAHCLHHFDWAAPSCCSKACAGWRPGCGARSWH